MRNLVFVLIGFLLLALESPLLQLAGVSRYAPDFVLITIIYLGLTTPLEAGLLMALVLGLLEDGFVLAAPIGVHMEVSVVAFLAAYRLSQRLALRGPLAVILMTIVFSLGASVAELALRLVFDRSFGQAGSGAGIFLASMLPQALITAPFGPILFWGYDRLDGLITRRSRSIYL